MDAMAARAFCLIHLSPDGLERIRVYERQATKGQEGRYLTASELVSQMQNKPINPTPDEAVKMEKLWAAYRLRTRFDEMAAVTLEKIWAWEDYAIKTYESWVMSPSHAQDYQESRADLA